ncbi:MAG TPA: hypothetical protein PKH93_11485, partial [Chitinophagales bacterium]|nr:hypothetical protein [Chitinophagales bacterium]
MSFDIVTNAGNEQYIVIDNNGGGTVNSFVDGPYGVVQVVTTLEANSNPLDMNGNPFTDANSQTLDWSTLNWQLVTITFHTTQDITITPNYSINGNSSNGVAFDNPVFGSCCAITCPDPRTDEIICKGIPPTGGFTYVLTTTLTGGNWTVSPTFPSIYIDQDPLDPTYLTTASGLPGGNTYTFTYNDGTCQDVITLTISDQSYTCASGIVVDTISVISNTTVSNGTVSVNAATYAATGILGGEVDVKVEALNTSATYESWFAFYDQYNTAEWINGVGDYSMATITWDGNDNDANSLDATGLGGVDLTSGGNFGFNVSADISKYKITLRVYTDASNYSESVFIMDSPQMHLYNVPVEFTTFTAVGGTGADMSDVGAVQLIFEPLNLLNESNGIDLGIECFHTPCVIIPCNLTATATGTPVSCNGGSDGTASATPSGN